MKFYCPQCNRELKSWSKYKDLKLKEGTGLALIGSFYKSVENWFCGESRSVKLRPNVRTTLLYYCESCKSYHLLCDCRTLIKMDEMPTETKTMVTCPGCGKKVLYALEDYSSGG